MSNIYITRPIASNNQYFILNVIDQTIRWGLGYVIYTQIIIKSIINRCG